MQRKSSARVIPIRAESTVSPDPGPATAVHPYPAERTRAVANRRYSSLLPASRESLAAQWLSNGRPLRVLAFDWQVETAAAEEMIRQTIRGWLNRPGRRAA
jgi:hypothetical protein